MLDANISNQSSLRRFSRIVVRVLFILHLNVSNTNAIRLSIPDHSTKDFVDHLTILAACGSIEERLSDASEVFYPSDKNYFENIHHYCHSSSNLSVCSIEPGTTADLAIIIRIIRQKRVPFAVKGGGHAMNPAFSSTRGIHIAMRRFRQVTYHDESHTVDVGAGLVWGDVYRTLAPYNITVVGGRVNAVGVAGLALGGGYGFQSNEYGLTLDNIFEYELVTPNGTIVKVNKDSYPDILFGLKGGFNNFGIVTNFNMRAVSQTQVYGGKLLYSIRSSEEFDQIVNALVNFQINNKDPKAVILTTITTNAEMLFFSLSIFYDGTTAPKHIFKDFIDMDHTGELRTLSMYEIVNDSTHDIKRGRFHTVSFTKLSARLLRQIANQSIFYHSKLGSKPGARLSIVIEAFLPTYLDNSQNSAYIQRSSSTSQFPICIVYRWQSSSDDHIFLKAMHSIADTLFKTMIDDGQYDENTEPILYPNYALETTPLSMMYGSNLPRLKCIRQAWDPEKVMYLTGGWKF